MTTSRELRVRLLGPVTCTLGDDEVDVGPPRQRAVLVMLVSSPGRVVTMGRLLEGLWGEDPPSRAEQSVYTYVAGLRRVLEPARAPGERPALLLGGSGGYRLAIEPGQVDVTAFAGHVAAGRRAEESGTPAEAARFYDQALDLWHGSALSGVPGPYADTERARLDDLYVAAVEGSAAARIRLGDAEKAVPGLRSLVRRHPLRPEALHVYEEAAELRPAPRTESAAVDRVGVCRRSDQHQAQPGPARHGEGQQQTATRRRMMFSFAVRSVSGAIWSVLLQTGWKRRLKIFSTL